MAERKLQEADLDRTWPYIHCESEDEEEIHQETIRKEPSGSEDDSVIFVGDEPILAKENPVTFIELPVSSDESDELPKFCTKERKPAMSVEIRDAVIDKSHVKVDTAATEFYEFYESDPKIPIYSTRASGMSSEELIRLLLEKQNKKDVCTKKPTNVERNATFIIDLNAVPLKSIYADDSGQWETSKPRKNFRVDMENGNVKTVIPDSSNFNVTLFRQYGTHCATKEQKNVIFNRIISTCEMNRKLIPIAIVQYFFKNSVETALCSKPHGNSKKDDRPYFRTDPETLAVIKSEVFEAKPKKLYQKLYDNSGGILKSESISQEPRNLKQIYNLKASVKKNKDELFELVEQIKSNDKYIKELCVGESIQYILASDDQLVDLERQVTNPMSFSVLSLDPTFKLGDFYVTTSSYENQYLRHRSGARAGKHPFFVGPVFVHHFMNFESYYYFSTLQRIQPGLKNIQAIGSDGEIALQNAIVAAWPDSIKLQCFLHKKDNIKNHLAKTCKLDSASSKVILNDIFGYTLGGISFEGLVSATDEPDFDYRLQSCQERWHRIAPGFMDLFIKNESQIFKTRMIFEVRNRAMIKKDTFTTNGVESKNSALKDWVDFSQSSLPEFNNKFSKFIDWQNLEAEKALYNQGQYTLDEKYSDLSVEYKVWKRMDANARQKQTRLYWNKKIVTPDTSFELKKAVVTAETLTKKTASASASSEGTDSDHDIQSLDTNPCPLDNIDLDVLSDNISMPNETVKNIVKKAKSLLSEKNVQTIVDAPGMNNTKIVASQTKQRPYFVVYGYKSGKITCECAMYKGSEFCSHTLAVACTVDSTTDFLQWRKKKRVDLNLTALVKGDAPKSGGKGGVTGKRKRKGGRSTDIEPDAVVNPFGNVSGFFDKKFDIVLLNTTKARVCYGCSNKLAGKGRFVVRVFGQREYFESKEKKSRLGNMYFHFYNDCITSKFPDFKVADLVIDNTTKQSLSEEDRNEFQTLGIDL